MNIRKAKITSVNHNAGTADITFPVGDQVRYNIDYPQPYAGIGWGIRAGIEVGTSVLVEGETSDIIAYKTEDQYFQDNVETLDLASILSTTPKYKTLKEGEIVLQSKENSLVFLNNIGDIQLSTTTGSLFELNKSSDSINQISVNQTILTEAVNLRNGLIKRDTRTEQEKIDDLYLSSLLKQDFSSEQMLDIIGVDTEHIIEDQTVDLYGLFDPEDGTPSILDIPGIQDVPNADKIVPNVKNPALTEYRLDVNEFSDGISSLNLVEDKRKLAEGRLPANLAARFVLGTIVDENGRMPRFDYRFRGRKGHGDIWKQGSGDSGETVDFMVDVNSSIQDPAILGDQKQWISSGISKFNSAIGFQLLLNTRGADAEGNIPGTDPGSIWNFQVDKQGLTKWNIPASTPLGEPWRNGRSLLWNMDGSLTQSIGKESNEELPNITGKQDKTKFVNVVPGRQERSWTADFEGTAEWRIGSDFAGQSWMVEADGGYSFYYGKYTHTEDSIVKKPKTAGLKSPSKSGKRIGTSISGRTEGSVEFDIGVNEGTNRQSAAINLDGVMSITIGEDEVKNSLILNTAGNIKFNVLNGGHKFEMLSSLSSESFKNAIKLEHGSGSLIQIDANGVITVRNSRMNSNIIMSATGDITLINMSGKISLGVDGTIGLGGATAGIDISPTVGVVLRTSGGSISLNLAGKVEVAANTGFTVTGLFSHLNTTGVALGPGAATSPNNVAAFGPGFTDPFTGNPCSISGFSHIKG